MKNTIPTSTPIDGADLNGLREKLGLSISDACWLYAIPASKWEKIVKENPKSPLKNPALALIVRALSVRPDLCPIPQQMKAEQVYDLVQRYSVSVDRKRFAIMFGCESSTGYRWLTMKTKVGIFQNRLFMVFQKFATYSTETELTSHTGFNDPGNVVTNWEKLVEAEAESRGIKKIFQTGCWTNKDGQSQNKRMTGKDIDDVCENLGLCAPDACWLFGLSMTKWRAVVKLNANAPIKNPSLSLLVRVLKDYPSTCPLSSLPDIDRIFDAIGINQREITKKRLAIMFGYEGSSGSRWLTEKGKLGPMRHRMLTVFSGWYLHVLRNNQETCPEGILAISEWDRLVEVEAAARGINDIFATGRWTMK